jgi:hypothetical protein
MSKHFQERLKQYGNPRSRAHWHGQSTAENIARWVARASDESDTWRHRAKDGEIELPPGGLGPAVTREAGGTGGVGRLDHAHEMARKDKNHVGGTHMRHVRRTGG